MKTPMLFMLLFICLEDFAQIKTTPIAIKTIPIANSYEISKDNRRIMIELNSAQLDSRYSGDEKFELYYNSGDFKYLPIPQDSISVDCALKDCGTMLSLDPESLLEGRIGSSSRTKDPLVLWLKRDYDHIDILINVIDSLNNVIQRRTLNLIGRTPEILTYKIVYEDGTESDDMLNLSVNDDLRGTKFFFNGSNLDQDFEKVSIGGIKLKRAKELDNAGSSAYIADNIWTYDKLNKLDIENTNISLKRYLVENPYIKKIAITTPKPIISQVEPIKLNFGTTSFNLELNVSNLYKGAKLIAEEINGQDVLRVKGELLNPSVLIDTKTISQKIELKRDALQNGSVNFKVAVRNSDGNTSLYQNIELQTLKANITASEPGELLPFVEGLEVDVVFTRGKGGALFQFGQQVELSIGSSKQVIMPRNVSDNKETFVAKVKFPLNSSDFNVPFELTHGDDKWNGNFTKIEKLPVLRPFDSNIYTGTSLTIELESSNPNAKAAINGPEGTTLNDDSFSDARINISVNEDVVPGKTIDLSLKVYEHPWKTEKLDIVPWPKPEKDLVLALSSDEDIDLETNKKVVIIEGETITVTGVNESNPLLYSKLAVQIVKNDGTNLGDSQKLVKSEGDEYYSTRINPLRYGLRGGDEFSLELKNPSGLPYSQNFYVKRTFPQNIMIQAGLSAINIFLEDRYEDEDNPSDDNKLPRTTLISGVNLGAYFMPEITKKEGVRPLGIGFNLHAQNQNSLDDPDVRFRYGPSLLIYETISMGISFRKDTPAAFFIGANINFLDFSKLFSSGSDE